MNNQFKISERQNVIQSSSSRGQRIKNKKYKKDTLRIRSKHTHTHESPNKKMNAHKTISRHLGEKKHN